MTVAKILNTFKSESSKKIAGNTGFQLAGKLVSMTITILVTALVARRYSLEDYGGFSLMQTWPAFFFIIVDFGLNAIALKKISENTDKIEEVVGNVLSLRILFSIFAILLAGAVLILFPYTPVVKLGIYLSLFLILTQALYATTNILFQYNLRYDLSTIGYVSGYILILILTLWAIFTDTSVIWVSFAYVAGGLLTFFINIYLINHKLGYKITPKFNLPEWKFLLIQALPLGIMFIFSQLNFKEDMLLLSVMPIPDFLNLTNTEIVGAYNLPYKIFEVGLVVATFFMNAVYPLYLQRMQESSERLLQVFYKSIIALILLGVFCAVAGFIFAPLAIKLLAGNDPGFMFSVRVLQLLVVGIPVFYITSPLSWLLVTLGKQKTLPFVYLVAAIFNFVLNITLIPRYSLYATAVTTWLSELLVVFLLIFFAIRSWKSYVG